MAALRTSGSASDSSGSSQGSQVVGVETTDHPSVDQLLAGGRLKQLRPAGPAAGRRQKRRILVADDSIPVRETERRLLESRGYEVEVAVDGMDAWNALRTGSYDLVVTDVDMPRMNGFEMIKLIRSKTEYNHIDIVVITGLEKRDIDKKGGVPPAVTIFPKPVPWQQVKGFVQAALSRRELAGRQR